MTEYIAILEDDVRRIKEMTRVLRDTESQFEPIIFDSAYKMVDWLKEHLADVVLISLDYDLPIVRNKDGTIVDFGSGEIVANYLSKYPPTCPVIIHSSNHAGASQMMRLLNDSDWPHIRVYPIHDIRWINTSWSKQVHLLLR
jgi:GR25 family glycosyltransferase involved in LPS biosynthesis